MRAEEAEAYASMARAEEGRGADDAGDHGVSGAEAEVESQCLQERGGAAVGAEVPGLQHDVAQEAEAEDRTTKLRAAGGENPQDVAGGAWWKPETNNRAAQSHTSGLGCVLPAHRSQGCVGRP